MVGHQPVQMAQAEEDQEEEVAKEEGGVGGGGGGVPPARPQTFELTTAGYQDYDFLRNE